jgi:hypothetical protein
VAAARFGAAPSPPLVPALVCENTCGGGEQQREHARSIRAGSFCVGTRRSGSGQIIGSTRRLPQSTRRSELRNIGLESRAVCRFAGWSAPVLQAEVLRRAQVVARTRTATTLRPGSTRTAARCSTAADTWATALRLARTPACPSLGPASRTPPCSDALAQKMPHSKRERQGSRLPKRAVAPTAKMPARRARC